MRKKIWYASGLRFTCLKCGNCCTGEPGYVWLTRNDIFRIAESIGMNRSEFLKSYCRFVQGRVSLLERQNGDCVFFAKRKGCEIYEARPEQCKLFPFWPHLLETESNWERESKRCPGIGKGKLYTCKEIENISKG